MSVASKVDLKTGEIKRRPCLDLSRHVNTFLQHWPTKLADLDSSAILIDPGDWQATSDVENQYFHVRVHPSQKKYLGFKLQEGNRPPIYYVFNVMIYGIKVAAAVVTRLIRPIVTYLHKHGIRFSIYIDNGRTVSSTSDLTTAHHKEAIEVFSRADWNIQGAKTSDSAT